MPAYSLKLHLQSAILRESFKKDNMLPYHTILVLFLLHNYRNCVSSTITSSSSSRNNNMNNNMNTKPPAPPSKHSPAPAPPKLPCVDPVITTKEGTYTYPLSTIQGKMMEAVPKSGGKLFLSVCANLPTGKPFCASDDPIHKTALAAYCPITQVALSISSAQSVTSKSYTALSVKDPKTGVRLRMTPISTVIKGGASVEFLCDAKSKTPILKAVMKQTPLGFNFTVTTSAACPIFKPAPSGGWSTLFLIISI